MESLVSTSSAFLILIILQNLVQEVTPLHSTFCIRLPKDKDLDPSYGETGDPDVASVGVEKFPQDIWGKYALSYVNNADDDLGKPTTSYGILHGEDSGLRIDTYPILGRPVGDDPLTGWLRIGVSLNVEKGFSSLLKSFILFATDEQLNFVGTFEYNPFPGVEQDCMPSDATRHMIIPCGGVSRYEAFASNVVLFARNNSAWPTQYQKYWPIVPDFDDKLLLNFYYRYNIQFFNKNGNEYSGIIIRIIADPDINYSGPDQLPNIENGLYKNYLLSAYAHFYIRPSAIPGAADPLSSDRTTLSCTHSSRTIGNANGGEINRINDPKFFETGGEYLSNHWLWYYKELTADPYLITLNTQTRWYKGDLPVYGHSIYYKTGCNAVFYGGRCESTFCKKTVEGLEKSSTKRNLANMNLIPQVHSAKTATCQCQYWDHMICFNEFPEKGQGPEKNQFIYNNELTMVHEYFTYYKNQVAGRTDRCSKTKNEVDTTKIKVIRRQRANVTVITTNGTIEKINVTLDKKTLLKTQYAVDLRGVRLYGFGTILYGIRKGHGIMMVAMSFFCVPVSIFVSRYYKETFMAKRILYSRVWYQVHVQLVFWMGTFFVAGILLALVGRDFLGVSLHPYGLMHRIFGWITFVFFIVLACTGGIRAITEPGRKWTILAHWSLGYTFYLFNVLSVISSIHVPGSPIAQKDKSVDPTVAETENKANYIYIVITVWIIFELVTHVSMNFLLHSYDRWMQVQLPRKFIPPWIGVPIPVLKENSTFDASGAGIRLILFWVYIGVAALTALLSAGIVVKGRVDPNKGFGPMTCTHVENKSLDPSIYTFGKYQIDPTMKC